MPLYDYHCPKCGDDFEALAPIARRDEVACKCGCHAERQITGGSFMLLGSGWSGTGHPKIVPPTSEGPPKGVDSDGYHTQYINCTPESVHRT